MPLHAQEMKNQYFKVNINEFSAPITGVLNTNKMVVKKINNIPLQIFPNRWDNKLYSEGFYCDSKSYRVEVDQFK